MGRRATWPNLHRGEELFLWGRANTHPSPPPPTPPPQIQKKNHKEKMESTATSLESNTENGTAPFCAGLCAKRERERES